MIQKSALELINISKSFNNNQVLNNVEFSLKKGEIHALVGHNGAGKSTLMKILLGVHSSDTGKIKINDYDVNINNPEQAQECGIGAVHQELNLFPELTVAENMFLGREFTSKSKEKASVSSSFKDIFKTVDKTKTNLECKKNLDRVGLKVSPKELVKNLSMGHRQLVEIAKGLSEKAKILVLDEPTSSLSVQETETLFEIMNHLSAEGVSIIFISHRMEEIFRICDKITVLRNGRLIDSVSVENTNKNEVIEMMMGEPPETMYLKDKKNTLASGITTLKVDNLNLEGVYKNINFEVKKGEILGITGLVGAGRTEILETIFGLRKFDGGTINYLNDNFNPKDPNKAVTSGIGFVTEDRKDQGLFLQMDVEKNISITFLNDLQTKLKAFGGINKEKEKNIINDNIKKLNIRTTNPKQLVTELSGGNQQKIVIAKWLAKGVNLLLLDEPTRGVDVSAKAEIYKLIEDFSKEGGTVLMVSSELDEVLGIADKIITIKRGQITGEFKPEKLTENKLMEMII